MSVDRVSPDDIQSFLDALKRIGLSIRKFSDRAAADEGCNLTDDEVKKLSETYRKRFSRKSISPFEFKLMQDILAMQPEFKASDSIYLSRKQNVLENKGFEKSLLAAFKSLH